MEKYHLFCAAARESKLLDKERLQTLISMFEKEAETLDENSGEGFAKFLIEKDEITVWQAKLLLRGKFRGFFLGNYKVLNLIGKGGMGTVYLVEHVALKKKRAIKVFSAGLNDQSSRYERFIREAQASASLEHPNIVRAFDLDKKDETHFIVLEYVDGKDLDVITKKNGPLEIQVIANYLMQVCEGLGYAHVSGMIHRDIKPANLIVDKKGVVKVLDMGLALTAIDIDESAKASLTIAHDDHLGTADYLAPEQAINSHGVDARADIYSLGGTLYFLLTGKPPFPDGSVVQRVALHQTKMPRPIQELRPDCPQPLIDICWKMLQKKPSDRFASAKEVKDAIGSWLSNGSLEITDVVPLDVNLAMLEQTDLLDDLAPESSSELQTAGSLALGTVLDNSMPVAGASILDLGFDSPSPFAADVGGATSFLQPSYLPPIESLNKTADEELAKKKLERTKLTWMIVGIVLAVGMTLGITAVLNYFSVESEQSNVKTAPAIRE